MYFHAASVNVPRLRVEAAGRKPPIQHVVDGLPCGRRTERAPLENGFPEQLVLVFRGETVNPDGHVRALFHAGIVT